MNFLLLIDEIVIAAIILLIFLIDFIFKNKKISGYFYILSLIALIIYIILYKKSGILLNGAFVYDGISWFGKIILLTGAIITGFLSIDTVKVSNKRMGAYYILLLSATLGMMLLISSKELITLYVGLELATVSLYALTAIYKKDDYSLEAGIKYLILGALSSGILLYGISLIYASTRTTYLEKILFYSTVPGISPVFILGIILILIGVCFKLSAVPMHVWTPDVYQGAPTPITAFISTVSKTAGFIFLIRLFSYTFIKFDFLWLPVFVVISFLTMTLGNLMAIPQKNIKRLLAYSTISQAGYILVGFVGVSVIGISSVIFYLFVYTFTNLAAFAVVIGFSNVTGSDEIDDYSGLAQREPLLALTFLLSLLSLAGIPPLAGFVGKFYLFYAAMQKDFLILVILATLNSTLSLYYYLLVLKRMYIFDPKENFAKIKLPISLKIALIITIAGILLLGILPGNIIDTTFNVSQEIFGR